MLGFIDGRVVSKNLDNHQCTVLVGGVGYEVTLSREFYDRVEVGHQITAWLHTIVKEDLIAFYGFSKEEEKHLYKTLLSVSGLGPKTAMSLINFHGACGLVSLILNKDADALGSAPGIGKKTSQKVILDLHPKIEKLSWAGKLSIQMNEPKSNEKMSSPQWMREDLSSALLNLGYLPHHVKTTLQKVFQASDAKELDFEACLKLALSEISKRPRTSPEVNS